MWFKSLLLLAVGCVTTVWGIEQMNSMEQVKDFLKDTDKQTLVLWDIDQVLLQSTEPAFHMPNMSRHKELFYSLFSSLNNHEQALLFALTVIHADQQLLDPMILDILRDLRERRIPHMGLTASLTGPLDTVDALETVRIEQLRLLGIQFHDVAPLVEESIFHEIPLFRGYPVLFREGILFANGRPGPKGDALVCFLKRCDETPTRIIFIDDRRHNVDDVGEKLSAAHPHIQYDGIHFTGGKHFDSPDISGKEFADVWSQLAERARELSKSIAEGEL